MMIYPLSPSQEAIYYEQKIFDSTPVHTISGYLVIDGPLDPHRFEQALRITVREHDALHIAVRELDGRGCQEFLDQVPFKYTFLDFSTFDQSAICCLEWMRTQGMQAVHLSDFPLFQFALLKQDQRKYYFFLKWHHILIDGWGISLFCQAVSRAYNRLSGLAVVESPVYSYRNFIEKETLYLQSERFLADREYWMNRLSSLPEPAVSRRRSQARVLPGGEYKLTLERSVYDRLKAYADSANVSMFFLFLSAISIYFGKAYDRQDLIAGVPILNRRTPADKRTVGLFMKVMPLRLHLQMDMTAAELVQAAIREFRSAYPHHKLPVYEMSRMLHLQDRRLFDFLVSYERHDYDLSFIGSTARAVSLSGGYEQNPLTVHIEEYHQEQDVDVSFEYNQAFFSDADIASAAARIKRILEDLVDRLDSPIREIEILTRGESARIRQGFNNLQRLRHLEKTIPELFEEQAARTPENTALVFEGTRLSYREVNERADRVARFLLERYALQPDERVGLLLERSEWMVIGILGVLKAGGAYVPVDPAYPDERIRFMIEDSGSRMVLSEAQHLERARSLSGRDVVDLRSLPLGKEGSPAAAIRGHHLAYVIYTSGSTGKPKGVMVEHRSVAAFCENLQPVFGIRPDDTVYALTTYTFDISVLELICSLTVGCKIVIERGGPVDAGRVRSRLLEERVTVLQTTPSRLASMLSTAGPGLLESVRVLLVGGEPLPVGLYEELRTLPHTRTFNVYGPTETTIWSSAADISRDGLSIGRPLRGENILILSKDGSLTPPGLAGEICIAGAGVARGYLNRPELTAERFLSVDPGLRIDDQSAIPDQHSTIYKTGDLGRWRPDGSLEFLGRMDEQVKIRGFRVELGEIEHHLASHPAIQAAAVAVRGDEAQRELAAYLVKAPGQTDGPGVGELRAFLRAFLPDYMIPSHFVYLPELPLTPNGKVDRRALPAPDAGRPELGTGYLAPVSQTERRLAAIWQEALKVERVGVGDNFFELGGHSLLLVQVQHRIRQEFQVDLSIAQMFQYPTIQSLARCLDRNQEDRSERPPERSRRAIVERARLQQEAIHRQDRLKRKGSDS